MFSHHFLHSNRGKRQEPPLEPDAPHDPPTQEETPEVEARATEPSSLKAGYNGMRFTILVLLVTVPIHHQYINEVLCIEP